MCCLYLYFQVKEPCLRVSHCPPRIDYPCSFTWKPKSGKKNAALLFLECNKDNRKKRKEQCDKLIDYPNEHEGERKKR